MDVLIERQKVVEAIDELPADALVELSNFIEYLRYKSSFSVAPPQTQQKPSSNSAFLQAIAGLGDSGVGDISQRDEEILAAEVDPVYGWKGQGKDGE
jgi:hypothetical protein